MFKFLLFIAIIATEHNKCEYSIVNDKPTVAHYHCQAIEANQCLSAANRETYFSQYILHDKGQMQQWRSAADSIMRERECEPGKLYLVWREANRIVIVTADRVYGTAYVGDIEAAMRNLEPERVGVTNRVEYNSVMIGGNR